MTARPPHRILFAVPIPEYLRFFGEVIERLRNEGHDIVIAVEREGKDPAALQRARAAAPVEQIPAAVPEWARFFEVLGEVTDYVRFLSPEFADKVYLRRRMDKYLPPAFASLRRVRTLPSVLVRAVYRAARLVERATPSDPILSAFLRRVAPDAIVLSPLVLRGSGGARQTQLLKAARRLGIPTALAVGSWDHLSSKGLIRVDPDLVFVWNETQQREAAAYHGIDPATVRITGAYPWDMWFRTRPSQSREAFLTAAGLPGDRPYVIYVGSSRGIAPPEAELTFVRQWLRALRASTDPQLRSIGVMIRPHPSNRDHWFTAAFADDALSIWPATPAALPMTPADHALYFDSLHFSRAVVGINTSAMIEAAIVGRPVLTIRHPDVAQEQTVHFAYLTREHGGSVAVAASLDEHLAQLASAIADPASDREAADGFVRRFVRPQGLDQPSSGRFLAAVEELAGLPHRAEPESQPLLAPIAAASRWLARRAGRGTPIVGQT